MLEESYAEFYCHFEEVFLEHGLTLQDFHSVYLFSERGDYSLEEIEDIIVDGGNLEMIIEYSDCIKKGFWVRAEEGLDEEDFKEYLSVF